MTEVWETTDNLLHKKPGENIYFVEQNVDMKWIQVPDSMGSKRLNVLRKDIKICSCKKHKTQVYYLEENVYCYHCPTDGGFVFCEKS